MSLNTAMILEQAARQSPDRPFLLIPDQRYTYAEVDAEARRFANVLAGLGVNPGEKVALLFPNVPSFVICYYGVLKLGAVCVPLNPLAPGPEIAYLLADSEAAVLVAYEPFVRSAVQGFQDAGTCRKLIVANLPGSRECPPPGKRLEELLSGAREDFQTAPTQPEEPAVIVYTSGTTGRPKGVVLTHFNFYYLSSQLTRDLWRLRREDVLLMVAPASHMFGQALINVACFAQAALSLMSKFEPQAFLQTIQRDKVTFFAGVPTLGHFLLNAPHVDRHDLSSLRVVMFGGSPMHPRMASQFKERFQADVITGYGMTEAAAITFVTADMEVPPGSVGLPVWGTTTRLVDEQERDVPAGEPGEIIARGPQFCAGYHNRPEETAETFRNGWFHTGDAGRMDEDGYLFIVDRLKDMIKVSGYAVFPAEVERVLLLHDAVAETAVIGVRHKTLGERVKAFVVLKQDVSVSEGELKAHCKAHLPAYKCPQIVGFSDELPKSPSGKVLRSALREQA